ncbi:MAG TPA: nucleoside-diphosphate sugar epimerase/dehydratase [Verrucomicrobiae bacterium]|jgi:FlaA1/EpsC-like NDP-sugar epimerase|nr:nucleoside-diphosphate sugar epimerase/dehydratase [Verrucomicrobiae bacterium]
MSLRRRLAPPPALTLLHDVAMAALSFPLSVWLRVGSLQSDLPFLLLGTAMFTGCAAAVFIFAGMNRGVWRYVSLPDLLEIARAVSLTVLLFLALQFLTTRLEGYPRSAMLINWFVLIILLGAPRFGYRLMRDGNLGQLGQRARPLAVPVLLVGAGDAAEAFIRVTRRDAAAPYAVIGILDRGGGRVGRRIHGVPVLAALSEATTVLERLSARGKAPQRFVLTDDGVDREGLRELVAIAEARGMTLARLPRMTELHHTDGNQQQALMPVAVEDLLGRPRQVLDSAPMRELIAGKRILITGAGGSIGSELARQIAGFAPARLALLDHSEFLLYEIDREIGALQPELARRAVLGDIRNRGRLESVFAEERPELVFHAAALKHVPLAEANPPEAVATNVLGTRQLAEVCLASGVDQMLLISTDKAVAPTSIMGAAKRAAELICQAFDRQSATAGSGCRFLAVRFGNVLGSAGSVVPLFQEQLGRGGPLTVTDPEMTRYFMTTREAVELVLQAAALARRQPRPGAVFMLDMGEPVRIVDLARQMIRLAGKQPEVDVKIVFTGKRPGEKLHERLYREEEQPTPAGVSGLLRIEPGALDWPALEPALDALQAASEGSDLGRLRQALTRLVPDYRSPEQVPTA